MNAHAALLATTRLLDRSSRYLDWIAPTGFALMGLTYLLVGNAAGWLLVFAGIYIAACELETHYERRVNAHLKADLETYERQETRP